MSADELIAPHPAQLQPEPTVSDHPRPADAAIAPPRPRRPMAVDNVAYDLVKRDQNLGAVTSSSADRAGAATRRRAAAEQQAEREHR